MTTRALMPDPKFWHKTLPRRLPGLPSVPSTESFRAPPLEALACPIPRFDMTLVEKSYDYWLRSLRTAWSLKDPFLWLCNTRCCGSFKDHGLIEYISYISRRTRSRK